MNLNRSYEKYFPNDWYYWQHNFNSIYSFLNFYKNKKDIKSLYDQIIKNVLSIYKFNNLKLPKEFNEWKKEIQSWDESVFNDLVFFIKSARNYTSHFWHRSDEYKSSLSKVKNYINSVVEITASNKICNIHIEDKIFVFLYILCFEKNIILYKPQKFKKDSFKIKVITNEKSNNNFPNIVSSSLNLINFYFDENKIKNFSDKTNYNFTKNFIKNILVPLLNYYDSNKYKRFFSASEINYCGLRKIKNYSLDRIYYYDNNKNNIKSFSIRTFFKWYINSFENINDFKPILQVDKINCDNLINFLSQKTKKQSTNTTKQSVNFHDYFNRNKFSNFNIFWKLNKTLKFFVREDAKKYVFKLDCSKIHNKSIVKIINIKNTDILKKEGLCSFFNKILEEFEKNGIISNKKYLDKLIKSVDEKNYKEISKILSKILDWEKEIKVTCDDSIKKILSQGRNYFKFINFFIDDSNKLNIDTFITEAIFFLGKKEFMEIIKNIDYSFIKEENYISKYYELVKDVLYKLEYDKYFDINKINELTKDNSTTIKKLSKLYEFDEMSENKQKGSNKTTNIFFNKYNEFKKEFSKTNVINMSNGNSYNKNIELFYIFFLLTQGDKKPIWKDSFYLFDSILMITDLNTSKVDLNFEEDMISIHINALMDIFKTYCQENKITKLSFSDFKKKIHELNNEFKEFSKDIFKLEKDALKFKDPLKDEIYIKFDIIKKELEKNDSIYKYTNLYKIYEYLYKNDKKRNFTDDIKTMRNFAMHYSKKDLKNNNDFIYKIVINYK